MTLKIKHKKIGLRFWLPLRLVLGNLLKKAKKYGLEIENLKSFRKEVVSALKDYKSGRGKLELLQVTTNDGTSISVKI